MSAWLYRAEARGIQRWILASDRLRELKGGSAIIEDLTRTGVELAIELGGEKIVAAAGGLTLRFPDDRSLRAFAAHWPMLVARRAPGLDLVHAWLPVERASELSALLAGLRPAPTPDLLEAGPLVARAGRTGLPSVRRGKDGDEDRATSLKFDVGRDDPLGTRVLGPFAPEWSFLEDVAGFGEGYVAVIHADGNNMGARFQGLARDLDRLAKLSTCVRDATEAAARAAVAGLIRATVADEDDGRPERRAGGARVLQARPIVLGGDDLCFIVHARYALPFATQFLRRFEIETAERCAGLGAGGAMTACAGVALVKRGWPFHAAHRLAESLCKAAKVGLKGRSGLLFHRVTTAMSDLDWADVVDRELRVPGGSDTLSGGPYDLDALVALERLARASDALPRGALQGWLGDLRGSSARAAARWTRLVEVAQTGSGKVRIEDWHDFVQSLSALKVNPDTGWRAESPRTTPIADALAWRAVQPGDAVRLWSAT